MKTESGLIVLSRGDSLRADFVTIKLMGYAIRTLKVNREYAKEIANRQGKKSHLAIAKHSSIVTRQHAIDDLIHTSAVNPILAHILQDAIKLDTVNPWGVKSRGS